MCNPAIKQPAQVPLAGSYCLIRGRSGRLLFSIQLSNELLFGNLHLRHMYPRTGDLSNIVNK